MHNSIRWYTIFLLLADGRTVEMPIQAYGFGDAEQKMIEGFNILPTYKAKPLRENEKIIKIELDKDEY